MEYLKRQKFLIAIIIFGGVNLIHHFVEAAVLPKESWIPEKYTFMKPSDFIKGKGIQRYYEFASCHKQPVTLLGSVKIGLKKDRKEPPVKIKLTFYDLENKKTPFILKNKEEKVVSEYEELYDEEPARQPSYGTFDPTYFPFPKDKFEIIVPEEAVGAKIETYDAAPGEKSIELPPQPVKPSFKLYTLPRCN